MPDDLQAVLITVGDDADARIVIDAVRGINQPVIDAAGQRCARQTRADARCNLSDADGRFKTALAAVRQSDEWHYFRLSGAAMGCVYCDDPIASATGEAPDERSQEGKTAPHGAVADPQ